MAELSDMPDEILLNIFENSNYNELSNLYKTNDTRLKGIAVDIVRRKYTQEEKDIYLIKAIKYGYTEIVEMLLKAGANVNVTNEYGDTALMLAVGGGHTEIVRMLIQRRADVNAKTNSGNTALNFGHTDIVRMLREHGATQ